ncbi:hypothetical protein N7460_011162 [Penicillium canescens]|uniref:Uncharacterized protein n=1 Tax=Penicillium canescens TaxID=5083 RepID=A0AAD6N5H4_PENCN|nr:hypothetical protein N7460_011162 [Penicillium canescens]
MFSVMPPRTQLQLPLAPKSTSIGTSTSTSTGSTTTSTHNAAVVNLPVSKSGLGLIALLFGSAFMAVIS